MGLDFVDLVMEVEDQLEIQLPNQIVSTLWTGRTDIQVRDFISLVIEQAERQRPGLQKDVSQITMRLICECADKKESQVSLESWFIKDLSLY